LSFLNRGDKLKWHKKIWVLPIAVGFCLAAVRAQNQTPNQTQDQRSVNPTVPMAPLDTSSGGKAPVPGARGVSGPDDYSSYDPSQVVPDTNALSGAALFGVGSLEHVHNIFDPSLTITGQGQRVPIATGTSQSSVMEGSGIFGGGMYFNRSWDMYRTIGVYNGGESIYYLQGVLAHSSYHDMSLAQEINTQRWHLVFRDDFLISPDAAFTGAGMGGPGLLQQFSYTNDSFLSTLSQTFVPAETIQTGLVKRTRNTALAQAEYSLSRRTAFTLTGSYGLLHFGQAGFISSHMLDLQAGYDYLLDPKNSIALMGSYGKIDYTGSPISTAGSKGELAFGRKVTGKLAFQIAAGPEVIQSAGSANGSFQVTTWSMDSSIKYDRRRSGAALAFSRALTSGSGVFFGSISDTFNGSVNHQFTRHFSGSATGGYAFNTSLVPAGVTATTFTTWFLGANMGGQLGRHTNLTVNYGLQKQNSPSTCPVASCGVTGYEHTVGTTLNWHLRPIE
jgi:hypothetical protein